MRIWSWRAVCSLIVAALVSTGACAHPHAWIDVRTTFVLSAAGEVSAMREEWVFDKEYTAFLIHESGEWKSAADFARTSLVNLKSYRYFISFEDARNNRAIQEARDGSSAVKDGRLSLRFTVPFAEALLIPQGGLSFSIFDPTYYIEMRHQEKGGLSFEGPGLEACTATLRQPDPPQHMRTLAQSLDKLAKPNPNLGKAFAETVKIRC